MATGFPFVRPHVAISLLLLLSLSRLLHALNAPPTFNLTNEAIAYLHSRPNSSPPQTAGTVFPLGRYKPSQSPACTRLQGRRKAIRDAVAHAWDGYERYAWGHDELMPLSKAGVDTFSENLGTTIVDSLSTLYVMGGLDGRYERGRRWVAEHLQFAKVGKVIVFETVIRILGGLMSMYHLSGDEMYLRKSEELGVRLAGCFETESGLPWPKCYLNESGRFENHNHMDEALYLAEVGSVQLEFRALGYHSRVGIVKRMRKVTESIIGRLQIAGSNNARLPGEHSVLLPYAMLRTSGNYCTNMVTMGAPADSYFEYLVKVWVQGGKKEDVYWELVKQVVDSMVDIGSYRSRYGDLIVRDLLPGNDGSLHYSHKMDHFACYIPGMVILAVGGLGKEEKERRRKWVGFAEEITETCYKMYSKSPSGLAGEHIRLGKKDEWRMTGGYQLRPEAVEAFFYMYRYTKKEKYREYGWKVFESIREHCAVESGGFAAIRTARSRHPGKEDVMHSFLIAETFKYLWLMFGEDDGDLGMDEWVFNTEAHPLLITPGMTEGDGEIDMEKDEL